MSIRNSTAQLCFILIILLSQPCDLLHCYECSDTFQTIWLPQTCQLNATGAAVRECNSGQSFCFVTKVTVVNRVISITRDCTDECFYGCQMTQFGLTSLTCTTCCVEDLCNTSDEVGRINTNTILLFLTFVNSLLLLEDQIASLI